jgi:hypothetical protein
LHPSHGFGSHWHQGHWRHARYHGRWGWWWVVGGIWYYYPERIEGPPDDLSDTVVPESAFAAERDAPATVYVERDRATYYAPGDGVGVSYRTGTACAEAQRQAGGAGICLVK